jgi:hypothetical protein
MIGATTLSITTIGITTLTVPFSIIIKHDTQ